MPKSSRSSNLRSLRAWRQYEQARPKSTLQEANGHNDNERAAAVLHGRVSQHSSSYQDHSHAIAPASLQENKRQVDFSDPDPSPQSHPANRKNHSFRLIPQSQGKKRKAASHPEERPPRRNRQQQSHIPNNLKDEAYVRRTMHVPTAQDYPQAPKGIFKAPKETITNGIQGLATMRSNFTSLAKDIWRCTLSYESASHTEVVEGEGRSKVS